MKRLLLTLIVLAGAQSCFAGLRQYHDDNCYVSTSKCKLFEVMNIRSGWRVLLPSHVHEGWLFKLRNGSLVNVVEFGNIICGILGTNGKMYYIADDSLGDSPDWTGIYVTPPPPPTSEADAAWAKAAGAWAN